MVRDFSTEGVDNTVDSGGGKGKNAAFSADSRWLGQIMTNKADFPYETDSYERADAQVVAFMNGR
jgi:hypothetical protein